jgi:HSP20 family protein
MAQEVRTVDRRTPATTESGQRTGPRPAFVPPADIYETGDNIVVLARDAGCRSGRSGHHARKAGVDDPRTKRC